MTQGKGFGFGLGKMKELADAFKKAQQVQDKSTATMRERMEELTSGLELPGMGM